MAPRERASSRAALVRGGLALLGWGASKALAGEMYPINFCTTYANTCADLHSKFFCSTPSTTVGCTGPSTYSSYAGACTCGSMEATRLEQQIVYHEIDRTLDSVMKSATTNGKTDFCAAFSGTCSAFLNSVACPAANSKNVGCTSGNSSSYANYAHECSCGSIDGALEARNSIIEYMEIEKVQSLTTKDGNSYIQFCPTFESVCDSFLDDISCPAKLRSSVGCTTSNDYSTYVGSCACGNIDASDRVRRLIIDRNIGLAIPMILGSFVNTDGTIDMCNSFKYSCDEWMQEIQCPLDLITNDNNCGSASSTDIALFKPTCTCGKIKASQRITDIILDTAMVADIPYLLCGTNGQCHPRRDINLVATSPLRAGGVLAILISFAIVVVLSGAFLPQIWTCSKNRD